MVDHETFDTIIIGAGMSGLAAGIRLAYYEQKVCLLERHWTIGGLNSFYRHNGRDYDVGLHALTNYVQRGVRRGPLPRLFKQLRLRYEDWALAPQLESAIRFPDVQLRFSNELDLLRSEIAAAFPSQVDNFERLLQRLIEYDDLKQEDFEISTRQVLGEIFSEPLLIEMLLCPLMWYGNAREHDMDFGQFCIMFRSIFMEGLARPVGGVRLILKTLVKRFRSLGGQLMLRSAVAKILVEDDRAIGVELEDGRRIYAKHILSSAGMVETLRMCEDRSIVDSPPAGNMSFVEAISVLDRPPATIGLRETIIFYNDSERFDWHSPADTLCDYRTGVICSPNNYVESELEKDQAGVVRVTAIASFDRWNTLTGDEYAAAKARAYDRVVASAVRFVPDYRRHVIDSDMFTPKTIRRYTSHDNGAVYGAPKKQFDGRTHLDNLYLCGTDQGFVGIVGSIVSGISMANMYCLKSEL